MVRKFEVQDRTTIGGVECIEIESKDPPQRNEIILVEGRQLKVLDLDKPWRCFDYSIPGPKSHDFWWLKVEEVNEREA